MKDEAACFSEGKGNLAEFPDALVEHFSVVLVGMIERVTLDDDPPIITQFLK